jgi:hypothetical protein
MKKIISTLLFLVAFFAGYSQMYNNGGAVTVESGATLVIEGNYTSTGSATIQVNGNVQLKGDFINNGGTVASGSTGTLSLNGTVTQNIGGNTSTNFYCALEVNNSQGVTLNGANEVLSNALTMTNGKLTLNAYDLTLAAAGVTGASSSRYIVTNSTGQLKAPVTNANYIFPVGDGSNYRPLILNEAGTADTYGVKFVAGLPGGWTGGTAHTCNGQWVVSEGTTGGNNLTATAQWNLGDENTSFDRTDCAVGLTTTGATVAWKPSGAASGTNPYYKNGSGFVFTANPSIFMVADYFFEGIDITLDMFLAGAYNAGTMSTALKTNNLIPLTDPYGNGTTVTSIPANAVDWIEVQLRNSSTPATIDKKYSFFVDNNGHVLNTDGAVGPKLKGVLKAPYYVAVRHRNHLGVMTASTINFTGAGPFAFNYSLGTGIYGTNAMKNFSGTYALWAGNANGDNQIIYQGASNDPTNISTEILGAPGNTGGAFTYIVNGYSNNDINMDGQVIYQGANNDPTLISTSVLGHPGNTGSAFTYAILQQLP